MLWTGAGKHVHGVPADGAFSVRHKELARTLGGQPSLLVRSASETISLLSGHSHNTHFSSRKVTLSRRAFRFAADRSGQPQVVTQCLHFDPPIHWAEDCNDCHVVHMLISVRANIQPVTWLALCLRDVRSDDADTSSKTRLAKLVSLGLLTSSLVSLLRHGCL